MSTKNQTTTTNAYNPGGMSAYNAFQPQLQSSLMQMAQNPLGNSYFQHQLAQQQAASQQIGQRNVSNSIQNLRTGGGILSNARGYSNAMINRNNIGNSGMQANAFNSAMNTSLMNRNMALSSMQAYQPLQTGQTSVQQQTGAGTWLTPLIGAAANMFMPALGKALSGGGGGNISAQGAMNGPGNPWGGGVDMSQFADMAGAI